ncbi:glycosidase [Haloferula luteola]|uniref:Glycosidase n=1 Tax=Haloferula luteola TaxID=595692 RepID=A0A840VF74_9BACT|nr:alpha-amylase family glycosyl hydrolase [Haloferula luteola]MBB5353278.1 glycosidase [Haloferula luteola]
MKKTRVDTKRRPVIYQTMVRLFGNTRPNPKPDGTLEENGCGKFSDFHEGALEEIRSLGATHLWLTGVLEQASGTSYPGRPAEPADVLKGKAGSPYAIIDYFDVCPDYADDPERRVEEFRDLLQRCRKKGLRVVMDFVPNHVARGYRSSVRPELSFGEGDEPQWFFHPDNNFYYVPPGTQGGGPPLKLPTEGLPGCTGRFAPEATQVKVTGNNAITFSPSVWDWYETVKLNYGHDFTRGRDTGHLPGMAAVPSEVPDTWRKMDEVFAYWQEMGVGGFRVDMAHMVPMEFWAWMLGRARRRDPELFVFGEAYDNDPAKLTDGNVLDELIAAGFDAVYDDPAYDLCMGLYDDFDGYKWANDLDSLIFPGTRFHHSLRYAENHDEVRLASPKEWGGLGMEVGRPVSAALLGMGRGPVMIYSGQEVGEPAVGVAGFSGDDGRTSIFDYTVMPEFQKWVNGGKYDGGRLSAKQKKLRAWYGRLLGVIAEPAFVAGDFYGLNYANRENLRFGAVAGEACGGHWMYAYLRRDWEGGQVFMVVVNFHPERGWASVPVWVPAAAVEWARIDPIKGRWVERLQDEKDAAMVVNGQGEAKMVVPRMPALSARLMEWVPEP